MNHYYEADYSLSCFSTKDGLEVDLVLTRGKKEIIFIEIKSSKNIDQIEVNKLAKLTLNTKIRTYYLSLDPAPQSFSGIRGLFWSDGIKEIFEN